MPRKAFEKYIDLDPIPYKTPEMNCRTGGVYYKDSPYKRFRDAMNHLAPSLTPKRWRNFSGRIKVYIDIRKDKPKTSKREWPKGDVDNYAKGINDRFNTHLWDDDDQICDLRITKDWSTTRKPRGVYIKVISL